MTPNPVAITPQTNLPKAHQLMKEYKVRRLPIVDNGRLVGIVTLGDIREASPSDATSLSIYELNYLLSNLTVKDIMTKDLHMVGAETSLHDAAALMLEKKIGGLPVMDGDSLVGIITESDIFRAVVEMFK
ncbi:MAG: CBS domain-containing protein [Chloroflexi bacterium]|nr:CBS domain-containing protein [Chloroflexota bacterium]MBI3159330.1 CBS domain-containing protein [Chloroflexota bacterium]